ncbi:glycerophosphodiester phosphodiesterase family protein [Mangrovihabitans endophyticus]|uniref:GP-PDE domain-containing protein n=1 Tax=Mangrovihabitans endophyticus TaxID=1751298 RepID=A0A8J3BVQ2_9ACTN|nr:glycerophosphodiester phosphodiesterase family protein [Mangrovihabitans endophyticus]GGK81733.1 hypothetical protein GCM10012284_14710 [Mangrovihabitans endophyticus]
MTLIGLMRAAAISMCLIGIAVTTDSSAVSARSGASRHQARDVAHQGGENEAPSNTMYAFRHAVAVGADMLEMDVESTSDDVLVAIHDAGVDRTTDGTGLVRDMTYRQVHTLDAAYNFIPGQSAVPGQPAEAYTLRGVRTHDRRPPRGYRADDFAVPSMREVLTTFRHVPLSVEIKGTTDADTESFLHNARLLAALVHRMHRTRDIVVTSFNDDALAEFHRLAPAVALAPGRAGLTAYFLAGVKPIDGTSVLQVPVRFAGIPVATSEFVARAHADGYAVQVWFSGTAPENATTYNQILDTGADGLIASWPTLLERVLDERRHPRPSPPHTAT